MPIQAMHTFRVEALTLDDLIRTIARELRIQWPHWRPDGPCVVIASHVRGEVRICVQKRQPKQPKQAKQ